MMKRLALVLALTACLGPVGASADTILVPDMGRSGIPGFHSETWDADALLPSRNASDLNTTLNDPRTSEWFPVDEPTKTGGWAWAWGHQNFNGRAIGRDHPPGSAPGGPTVVIPVVVAEPASLVLVGTGLIVLAGAVRRRARS